MRVLLVSHSFPPEGVAGVERYTEGLARELAGAGDRVSVATGSPAAGGASELVCEQDPDGVALYRLKRPATSQARFLRHSRALDRLFATVLRETSPEVVHVNHLIGLSPRFVAAAHRYGAAVVLSLWDHYFVCARHQLVTTSGEACAGPDHGRACARTCFSGEGAAAARRWGTRTAYFQLLLQTAERILCPSRYLASRVEPLVREPGRMRLLPLGLPGTLPERRAESLQNLEAAPLHLAVLGLVFANKGAHIVLDALELAALPAARLSLYGQVIDRAYVRALEQRAAEVPGVELEVGEAYHRDELPDLLAGVDCVVVPSQWPESFAFVAREAISLSVPVLVSRKGALPEAVIEGENGFTFAHDDPAELARLLRRLGEDDGLLARLRAGACRRPPLPIGAHARAVRAVYADAAEDFARGGATTEADRLELARLERQLVALGFDGNTP